MHTIKARLLDKRAPSGYGERLTIAVDAPTPKFSNLGWNCFHCAQLERIELDQFPPIDHPSNVVREWQKPENRFSATVRAEFKDGGSTWIFLTNTPEAYDPAWKSYTRPIFNVQG